MSTIRDFGNSQTKLNAEKVLDVNMQCVYMVYSNIVGVSP